MVGMKNLHTVAGAFLLSLALTARAQGAQASAPALDGQDSVPSSTAAAQATGIALPRTEAEGGIPMLDEKATGEMDALRLKAKDACEMGAGPCLVECRSPNSEACIQVIGAWMAGVMNDQRIRREPTMAVDLARDLCKAGTARLCARAAVLLREHADSSRTDKLVKLAAGELLGDVCSRGFKRACEWQRVPPGESLPPGIAQWGHEERRYSTDPVIANCDDPLTPPRMTVRQDPVYPEEMRRRNRQGRVNLEVTIELNGAVSEARVTSTTDAGFDLAALTAVRKWRYVPSTSCGLPYKTLKTVTIVFKLH